MNDSKKDYRTTKRNTKTHRKDQQKLKNVKNASYDVQDIPEGMYNTKSNDTSYLYHEKEVKTYSNDVSDLLQDEQKQTKNNENMIDNKEEQDTLVAETSDDVNSFDANSFDANYFEPVAYVKKNKK